MFEVREEEEKPVRAFLVGCVKAESINTAHFDVFASNKADAKAKKNSESIFAVHDSGSTNNANEAESAALEETVKAPELSAFSAPERSGREELQELFGLVKTLGMEICDCLILTNRNPHPRFGIGLGKAAAIAEEAKEQGADCIIFDFEISPTHQRNWEKLANMPVFDRHEVILRIFASRARTKEASLQVELAKLQYSLPRLAHSYGDMAKQRGGNYGAKGSGETKLELDRRAVQNRISRIKIELAKVVKERETLRSRRDKVPLPSCALVGYTNAGKSSLLNALTGSEVFVEDKLFATLDPTTRRLSFDGGTGILLTDTVGFISNLPHSLVNAFKSTLEETARADLQLLVLDASDGNICEQYQTVLQVLKEIDALNAPRIIVLNKIDSVKDMFTLRRLENNFPQAVRVSALEKTGFDKLISAIRQMLFGAQKTYELPLEKAEILELIRKTGILISSEWQENAIKIEAQVSGKAQSLLAPYEILHD